MQIYWRESRMQACVKFDSSIWLLHLIDVSSTAELIRARSYRGGDSLNICDTFARRLAGPPSVVVQAGTGEALRCFMDETFHGELRP
jgi:hypothetical protein